MVTLLPEVATREGQVGTYRDINGTYLFGDMSLSKPLGTLAKVGVGTYRDIKSREPHLHAHARTRRAAERQIAMYMSLCPYGCQKLPNQEVAR